MSAKAIKEIKLNGIQLTFWENNTREGKRFVSVSLKKSYKDSAGNWQNTEYFSEYDLPSLLAVIERATMSRIEIKELKGKNNDGL